MRFHYSATALALITTSALAEECPTGYEKSKGLAWTKCAVAANEKLQCATIEVPRDWKNPASAKMKLRLVRHPAQSETPRGKSVIINPGGPGASGIEAVIGGGSMYQDIIGDDFHIIGFDPRGVGLTLPYTCVDKEEGTKAARAVKEIEDQEGYYNSYVSLADKCDKQEVDGKLIGTAYVARDVKAIAESLGEDGLIRYMGYSYGTLLGATLSAMFPSQIDRIVLDGNVSPQNYYHKLGTESAADLDNAFKRFFELCAKAGKDKANKPNCPWAVQGQNGLQLTRKFDTFLDTLTAEQSNVVRDKFFNILYKPSGFKKFAQKLHGWYEAPSAIPKPGSTDDTDDRDGKKKRQDAFKPETYKTVLTTNAISGISCGDRITRLKGSADNFKQWLQEYRSVTKYGYDLSSAGDLRCSVWPTIANERFDVPRSGIDTKNPILFVNTPYDPVTPMISAEDSAKSFTKAGLLRSSGVGHCSTANWSKKLNEAIKSYMITGEIPKVTQYEPDTENVFDEEPEAPAVNAGVHSKRGYQYPSFFSKREEAAAAHQIPVDCTKIAVASSVMASLSSSVASSAAVSQSVSTSVSASISVFETHQPTPAASASVTASASESPVLSHSESASASILVQQSSSVLVQASSAPDMAKSESQIVIPTPSAVAHSESASVSIAHSGSASVQHSEATTSLSASANEMRSFPSSSVAVSVSVSASDLPSASLSAADHIPVSSSANGYTSSVAASVSASTHDLPTVSSSAIDHISASSSASEHLSSSRAENTPSSTASASIDHFSAPSTAAEYPSSSYAVESASASASADFVASTTSTVELISSLSAGETPAASASHEVFISSSAISSQGLASVTAIAHSSFVSSAKHAISSGVHSSSDISASQFLSSYDPLVPSSSVHIDDSTSAYAEGLSSTHIITASVSSYAASESSSSVVYPDSSVVHPSATSSAFHPDVSVHSSVSPSVSYPDASIYSSGSSSSTYSVASVYPSGYSSTTSVQSSQYPYVPSSSIEHHITSVIYPSASSSAPYYPSSINLHPSGSSIPGSEHSNSNSLPYNYHPIATPYTTSIPVQSYQEQPKSDNSKHSWSNDGFSYPSSVSFDPQDPKSVEHKQSFSASVPARSSSIFTYAKHPASSASAYLESGEHSTNFDFYPASTPGPEITSTPCPTVAWSFQPGYVPITRTYTTTNVRTVTKCPETGKDCPLISSTKAYITTEIKTRTTVVATPSSPPTGDQPHSHGKETDSKLSAPPSKDTGKVTTLPKSSNYPLQPTKDAGKYSQPPKETEVVSPSQPAKDTGHPVPSKSTGKSSSSQSTTVRSSQPSIYASYPPKQTHPIQSTHSVYAPTRVSSAHQLSSTPTISTSKPMVPLYPTGSVNSERVSSVKVCNDMSCSYISSPTGTKKPAVPVGTGSTTVRTSSPSVTACTGKVCKAVGTPTGYKPAQFTGAASSKFVSSMVGAAGLVIGFANFL